MTCWLTEKDCDYKITCFIDLHGIYYSSSIVGTETITYVTLDGKCRCKRCNLSVTSPAFVQNHERIE